MQERKATDEKRRPALTDKAHSPTAQQDVNRIIFEATHSLPMPFISPLLAATKNSSATSWGIQCISNAPPEATPFTQYNTKMRYDLKIISKRGGGGGGGGGVIYEPPPAPRPRAVPHRPSFNQSPAHPHARVPSTVRRKARHPPAGLYPGSNPPPSRPTAFGVIRWI